MDREQFWRLIDETRPESWNCNAHSFALIERLASTQPREIVSFQHHFLSLLIELDRAQVAAVASMVLTFLSDDGFENFRAWAILQGRQVVEDLLYAPERVARHFPTGIEPWCELALVIGMRAYEQRTGCWDLPIESHLLPRPVEESPLSDDEIRQRFPVLWKRFVTREEA